MEKTATTKKTWTTRAFLISLAALILCSVVNWGAITGWGKVTITRINLIGDDGLEYSGLLYVPANATNETPAPAIYMVHGGSGNARNHETWAIEFSRRGFVCLSVDWLGGGNGETYNTVENTHSIMDFDNGVHDLFVQYLLSMPIVDETRFVSSGHSLGSGAATYAGNTYGAKAIMTCGGGSGNPSNANIQLVYGDAEFTPRTAHLRSFLRTLNSNGFEDITDPSQIEVGKLYTNEAGHFYRFVSSDMQRHEAAFFNTNTIASLLEFADMSVGMPIEIDYNDQVWAYKEVIGLIGIHVYVCFLITLALLLIQDSKFFAEIKQPLPRNIGLRGKGMAISYIAGIVFPLLVLLTGAFGIMTLFGSGLAENKIALFSMGHTSKAMTVTIGLSLLGILMLVLYMKTEGKKHNATIRDLGLTSEGATKLNWLLIGKALLLAVIVVFIGQTYLGIQADTLGTEFYCIIFSMKEIPLIKFHYYLPYIVVWMLCFIVTSVSLNVERRLPSTGDERKDTIIAVIVNTFMNCIVMIAVISIQNYFQVRTGGTGEYIFQNWGMEINRLWGMPTGMALAGAGQTYCYRKTGNIWLGAFLMALICAIMACSGGTTMTAIVQTAF